MIAAEAPGIFVFLWSSGFVVARYALRDAGPFTFLTMRLAITMVVMVAFALTGVALTTRG